MWRLHLHQHPRIPLNDSAGTHLTADEIHSRATKDVYQYCRKHGLAQAWAYFWNRWYTPKQWVLWARASSDAIPRTKTTMMVESTWKQLKRRDLHQFNRPRLDLLTYIVLVNLLPRVRRKMQYILKTHRRGRPHPLAKWQEVLKKEWHEMSKPDEWRLMSKELKCRKLAVSGELNPQEKQQKLTNIELEQVRPKGLYHTSISDMTCSCPSFVISRFLLCKHLVREINEKTNNAPLNNLPFFRNLRRNHYPPYYIIPEVHTIPVIPVIPAATGEGNEVNDEREGSPLLDHDGQAGSVDKDLEPETSKMEQSSPFCSDDEGEESERVSFVTQHRASVICQ